MSLSNWMAGIPDGQSLSDIAMPGTHDSATYDAGSVNWKTFASALGGVLGVVGERRYAKFVQCQSRSVAEQLNAGVRFLDFRVMPRSDGGFDMCHGKVALGINLNGLLDEVEDFLKANSRETVLVCFKRDDDGDRSSAADQLKTYLAGRSKVYYTKPKVPLLKDVRGKVVVINRVFENDDCGIFINFDNNCIFEKDQLQGDGSKVSVAVQDCYDPHPIEDGFFGSIWSVVSNSFKKALAVKLDNIEQGYKRFANGSHQLRLSFMSATTIPNMTPGEYAAEINPKVRTLLRDHAGSKRWITLLDYVGEYGSGKDEPCAAIISTNDFDKGPGAHRDTLTAGETLSLGDALLSANGAFKAEFQKSDGNFVVYRLCDGHAMAATMTNGKGADRATLQTDGNFVVYAGTTPKSATVTDGKGAVRMVMQSDGNLVLYKGDGSAVWATDSQKFTAR